MSTCVIVLHQPAPTSDLEVGIGEELVLLGHAQKSERLSGMLLTTQENDSSAIASSGDHSKV
jgi:hypothetical protein